MQPQQKTQPNTLAELGVQHKLGVAASGETRPPLHHYIPDVATPSLDYTPSSLQASPKNPPHELSPAPPHGVLVAIFQEFKDLLQDTTLITRLSKRSRSRNGADRALLCYIPFPHFMPKWPPLTHQSRENRSSEAPTSYFMPTWPSLTPSSRKFAHTALPSLAETGISFYTIR